MSFGQVDDSLNGTGLQYNNPSDILRDSWGVVNGAVVEPAPSHQDQGIAFEQVAKQGLARYRTIFQFQYPQDSARREKFLNVLKALFRPLVHTKEQTADNVDAFRGILRETLKASGGGDVALGTGMEKIVTSLYSNRKAQPLLLTLGSLAHGLRVVVRSSTDNKTGTLTIQGTDYVVDSTFDEWSVSQDIQSVPVKPKTLQQLHALLMETGFNVRHNYVKAGLARNGLKDVASSFQQLVMEPIYQVEFDKAKITQLTLNQAITQPGDKAGEFVAIHEECTKLLVSRACLSADESKEEDRAYIPRFKTILRPGGKTVVDKTRKNKYINVTPGIRAPTKQAFAQVSDPYEAFPSDVSLNTQVYFTDYIISGMAFKDSNWDAEAYAQRYGEGLKAMVSSMSIAQRQVYLHAVGDHPTLAAIVSKSSDSDEDEDSKSDTPTRTVADVHDTMFLDVPTGSGVDMAVAKFLATDPALISATSNDYKKSVDSQGKTTGNTEVHAVLMLAALQKFIRA